MTGKRLAMIIARGGSKRIPRKNIKEFCGKPILLYSIEAALQSKVFDEVMVSTEDEEIAVLARKAGAAVPFMRSKDTAGDYASTDEVILEVLQEYEKRGVCYESFCCIYPTAPFLTPARLKEAMELLKEADSVMPVVAFSYPPQRGVIINSRGYVERQHPQYLSTRSQDLEKIYHDCGQFYACKTKPFMEAGTTDVEKLVPLILTEMEVQDIDTPQDWEIAEIKFQRLNYGEKADRSAPFCRAKEEANISTPFYRVKEEANISTPFYRVKEEADISAPFYRVKEEANISAPFCRVKEKADVSASFYRVKEEANISTPFYRVKEKELLYDINLLKESLDKNWGNYIMGYSVKTNALPWLLVYLREHGFYAEVVSAAEYDLAVRLGYREDKIIYNSPIKQREVWEKVLLGGGYVNFDSTQELKWIHKISLMYPEKQFKIGLRVNCNLARLCPEEEPAAGECGRFGYCYENGRLKDAIEEIRLLPNVKVAGLHLHSSTKSRTVQVYGALAKMAVEIAKEYALNLEFVDMGGGYFGGREDKPDYRDYFKEIGKELKKYFDPTVVKLIAEPGVSLISRSMSFETTVLDIKEIRENRFIVTDGSRVNLNPLVTRHEYPHHILYASKPSHRRKAESQWVCGATCMEYDRLFEIRDDVALQVGDRIVYDTAGGYTMCLSPLFINYFPAIWVEKQDGSMYQAREPWTNDEYLQKYHWD